MGIKRSIKHVSNNTEENLSVPPGFVSLTSFKLRRIATVPEASGSGREFKDVLISNSDIEKLKTSFLRRPWICHGQFDRVPQSYEAEQTDIDMKDETTPSLPKGVIRGCPKCHDCVKVTARWHPENSCLPVVDDALVFWPTEEEFKNIMEYIAKIRPKAENYGICRIVPPLTWKPPSLLEDRKTWEALKFSTHVQKIHGLKKLYLKRKLSGLRENTETKMSTVANEFVGDAEETNSTAVDCDFECGPEFNLKSFKMYADDFRKQYFSDNGKLIEPKIRMGAVQDKKGPLIARTEGEYWRIVENPSEEIEVLCGANLGSQSLGSGLITATAANNTSKYSKYVESQWNLNNIPKLSGSLLPFGCYNTSDFSNPQLLVGMCFASQCWTKEDHHLYSLSYMHLGDPKVWYGVPGRYCFKVVEVLKKRFPQLSKHPKLLHELVPQLSPSLLKSEGIPVYRCVQNPLEFVVVFPGAYHSNFSCGFNCSESVRFAPFDWLPHGQNIVELYSYYCLKPSISHDRLLLGAAMEAVTAQWESFVLKKDSSKNRLWGSVCGKDGILTRSLNSRVRNEEIRRKHLCNLLPSRKLDEYDLATKRECSMCLYDLYLSAVACSCSPTKHSCLRHAKQLCSCPWSDRYALFRYEITELHLLVEALEGNLKGIHIWAKRKAKPNASQKFNHGDRVPIEEVKEESLYDSNISTHVVNGKASGKNLMPASGTQHNAANCTAVSLTNLPSGRHVISPLENVVVLSDDED